jgi:single-strand DNA-binding protein
VFLKAEAIGHLGQDPVLKTSQSGTTTFCNFSVATNKGSGENKKTLWINVTTFGKTAEFANKYLRKGSLVRVQGDLELEEYQKDGTTRTTLKIVANELLSLSRSENTAEHKEQAVAAGGISAEDLPF